MKTKNKKIALKENKKVETKKKLQKIAKKSNASVSAKRKIVAKPVTRAAVILRKKPGIASVKKAAVLKKRTSGVSGGKHEHIGHQGVDRQINAIAAIFFIAVLSSIIGTLIFLDSKNEQRIMSELDMQTMDSQGKTAQTSFLTREPKDEIVRETNGIDDFERQEDCIEHKFEGQSLVHGWYASEQEEGVEGIMISVSKDDLERMPMIGEITNDGRTDVAVRLIDASEELIGNLKDADSKNPHEFTVKGYMFDCNGKRIFSIQLGSKVFQKS